MKSVYLLLSFIAFLDINCLAQRSAGLQLLPTYVGASNDSKHVLTPNENILFSGNGNAQYWFTWRIKNLGPDELLPGDTLAVRTGFDTVVYYVFPTGKSLKKDSMISIVPVNNNTGLQVPIALKPLPSISTSATDTVYIWCDSVYANAGNANTAVTDPLASDNIICDTVRITYWLTGINSHAEELNIMRIYPNPASGILNITTTLSTEMADVHITMRDLTGRVVYHKALGKRLPGVLSDKIDVSILPHGMYIGELVLDGKKHIQIVNVR